jgi:hypothetical protein
VGLLDLSGDFGNEKSTNDLPLACEYEMEQHVRRNARQTPHGRGK